MAVTFLTNEDESRFVKTVNGVEPDKTGNVEIAIPDSGWKAALNGAVITATGDSTVSATTGASTVGGYVRIIADLFGME